MDYMEKCNINGDNNKKELKLEKIDNANSLHEAFNKSKKGVTWKKSVQKFRANELRNILKIQDELENNTYKPDKPNEFTINERGRTRYIKANSIEDRVVQRSFNDNVLLPIISDKLIYNNCASLPKKGLSLSRELFENDMHRAFREFNKDEGYILFIDFSKYFDNICHSIALEMFRQYLTEEELNLLQIYFSEFEIDLSYMSDDEFQDAMNKAFNILQYNEYINENNLKDKLDSSKILYKSVGIGNQLSQITGIYYPHEIDNYCKIVKSIKYYGRYMDDTYVILRTKEECQSLLKDIDDICKQLGIFINYKKTHINSIHNWNTYLKINYYLIDTGKLIRKPVSETFKRERRKLTKYKHLLENNIISLQEIANNYHSWRNSYIKYDCNQDIFELDNYFIMLFSASFDQITQ